jgi:predicted nucleic acid-binding protein
MSIIFCNTTPFIALASINRLDLMPRCFGNVHVVTEVMDECAVGGRVNVPDLRLLDWVIPVVSQPVVHTTLLLELDKGEKHTIDMAKRSQADWVIIDEKIGRNLAEYLGLRVTGTLGILLKAKQQGWIDSFLETVSTMQQYGIRYHPDLVRKLAQSVGE